MFSFTISVFISFDCPPGQSWRNLARTDAPLVLGCTSAGPRSVLTTCRVRATLCGMIKWGSTCQLACLEGPPPPTQTFIFRHPSGVKSIFITKQVAYWRSCFRISSEFLSWIQRFSVPPLHSSSQFWPCGSSSRPNWTPNIPRDRVYGSISASIFSPIHPTSASDGAGEMRQKKSIPGQGWGGILWPRGHKLQGNIRCSSSDVTAGKNNTSINLQRGLKASALGLFFKYSPLNVDFVWQRKKASEWQFHIPQPSSGKTKASTFVCHLFSCKVGVIIAGDEQQIVWVDPVQPRWSCWLSAAAAAAAAASVSRKSSFFPVTGELFSQASLSPD